MREHLDAERQRILSEAIRLSDGAPLSAFDIVNAAELLESRDRLSGTKLLDSRGGMSGKAQRIRQRERAFYSAFMLGGLGILGALVSALLVYSFDPSTRFEAGSMSQAIIGILAGIAVAAMGSFAFIAFSNARSRSRQLTFDEFATSESVLAAADSSFGVSGAFDMTDMGTRRQIGSFLTGWISLEMDLRELGTSALGIPEEDARRYPLGELLRLLVRSNVITEEAYSATRSLLALRNAVMHAGSFDAAALKDSENQIASLRSSFKAGRAHLGS